MMNISCPIFKLGFEEQEREPKERRRVRFSSWVRVGECAQDYDRSAIQEISPVSKEEALSLLHQKLTGIPICNFGAQDRAAIAEYMAHRAAAGQWQQAAGQLGVAAAGSDGQKPAAAGRGAARTVLQQQGSSFLDWLFTPQPAAGAGA